MAFSIFPIKNFPNELIAFIFSLLFIIILLTELRILTRYKTDRKDKGSFVLIIFGIFILLIATITLSYTNIGGINNSVSYLGMALIIIGFILRQYSIKILGRFFIPTVSKQKSQRIIQTGPYRYIRHPSYTGLILELVGLSLALSNIMSLLITLIFILPIIIYRIKVEESFLIKNFKEYRLYKQKTKKLIPFIY